MTDRMDPRAPVQRGSAGSKAGKPGAFDSSLQPFKGFSPHQDSDATAQPFNGIYRRISNPSGPSTPRQDLTIPELVRNFSNTSAPSVPPTPTGATSPASPDPLRQHHAGKQDAASTAVTVPRGMTQSLPSSAETYQHPQAKSSTAASRADPALHSITEAIARRLSCRSAPAVIDLTPHPLTPYNSLGTAHGPQPGRLASPGSSQLPGHVAPADATGSSSPTVSPSLGSRAWPSPAAAGVASTLSPASSCASHVQFMRMSAILSQQQQQQQRPPGGRRQTSMTRRDLAPIAAAPAPDVTRWQRLRQWLFGAPDAESRASADGLKAGSEAGFWAARAACNSHMLERSNSSLYETLMNKALGIARGASWSGAKDATAEGFPTARQVSQEKSEPQALLPEVFDWWWEQPGLMRIWISLSVVLLLFAIVRIALLYFLIIKLIMSPVDIVIGILGILACSFYFRRRHGRQQRFVFAVEVTGVLAAVVSGVALALGVISLALYPVFFKSTSCPQVKNAQGCSLEQLCQSPAWVRNHNCWTTPPSFYDAPHDANLFWDIWWVFTALGVAVDLLLALFAALVAIRAFRVIRQARAGGLQLYQEQSYMKPPRSGSSILQRVLPSRFSGMSKSAPRQMVEAV